MADNYEWPVAKKFFVTGGKAQAETPKGAMQKALIKAKIQQTNLVPVSSVLNPEAKQLTEIPDIPHAAIVYCVMAEEKGDHGESIAAGVGWCYMRDLKTGRLKAYVVEDHGGKEERAVKKTLFSSLMEMADAEGLEVIPLEKTGEPLKSREKWEREQKTDNDDAWTRYLDDNANRYFRTEIHGIDEIRKPFGYAVAALVYVFERP